METNNFFDNKVLVGLGNPGKKYEETLHNAGFIILDNFFVLNDTLWREKKELNCLLFKDNSTIFIKPSTYMNNSGTCVSKVLNFYKLFPQDLIVIHDDVDLEFGQIKLVKNRGAGGHHGVLDIAQKLGTLDFYRIRIGVGRPHEQKFDVQDYVLSTMSPDSKKLLLQSFESFLKTV